MRRSAAQHYQEVLRTALESAQQKGDARHPRRAKPTQCPQTIPTEEALGRVLAEDCRAQLAIPRFSQSAMDGVLVDTAHLPPISPGEPATLPLVGDVPAGSVAQRLDEGTALRIMTGAPVGEDLPDSVQVIPVEQTDLRPGAGPLPDRVCITELTPGRRNIRQLGENLQAGDVLARAGTSIDAGTIAALLSAGIDEVSVHPVPRVAIISSGEEITPGTTGARIPDSNGPMLAALVHTLCPGATVTRTRTRDNPVEFRQRLDELAATHDLIVTSGGISAGAYEVVREVIDPARTDHSHPVWCGALSLQPGKPQGLGQWGDALLLSFPGNPVACYVSSWLFLAPALEVLSGRWGERPAPAWDEEPSGFPWSRHYPFITAEAAEDFPAPRAGVLVVPVRLESASTGSRCAHPFSPGGKGSHRVGSLVGVQGLVLLDAEHPAPGAGDPLSVFLLPSPPCPPPTFFSQGLS